MTGKGGMTDYDRKHKQWLFAERVRNTKDMRKRQGHSIGYGKKETVHSRNSWKRYCTKII